MFRIQSCTVAFAFCLAVLTGLMPHAAAGTHAVEFTLDTGDDLPTGTVTFADPEPTDDNVPAAAFEFTDGISTWTETDSVIGFNLGGFQSGELMFLAIKVIDDDTGRGLEIFSSVPGTWASCDSPDPVDYCSSGFPAPDNDGEYTLSVAPGSVPNGGDAPGEPLRITKAGGGMLTLTWGDSCSGADNDYEIYTGFIGMFYSHVSEECSTAGDKTYSLSPDGFDRYYLVVPTDGVREGSYGRDGDGLERPSGGGVCHESAPPSCPVAR